MRGARLLRRGRSLSLALLLAGLMLVPIGIGLVMYALMGAVFGVGSALALLGAMLIVGGLFLVPTDGGGGAGR